MGMLISGELNEYCLGSILHAIYSTCGDPLCTYVIPLSKSEDLLPG